MAKKTNLNPDLTLGINRLVNLGSVTKLINGYILPKFKGSDDSDMLQAMKNGRGERIQPSVSDLRMVVRFQRKNKHPHSTKKHK
jgi:hypothetical protein